MASFLDMLAPYLTTATEGVTAYRSGQAEAAAKAEADALAALERRAAEARERRTAELDDLNRQNTLSLIRSRDAETERTARPAAPRRQLSESLGGIVDLDTATVLPVQGAPAAAKSYEERPERGGVAVYENGRFKTWKVRPPTERGENPLSDMNRFQMERGLAGEFRQEQGIKDAEGVASAVATVRGALANPTPQGDLAAIYALVKLYDPGSVVREGEISLTQSAASLPEQVRRLYQGWASGKKLTPQMRADLASVANSIVAERQTQVNPILERYGNRARAWNVDSAAVAPNPLQSARIPQGGGDAFDAILLRPGQKP